MNISLQQKHHDLAIHQAQVLATILRDIDIDDPILDDYKTRHIASAAGSEKKLRGIPIVGAPGVGGTVRGTSPLQALVAKQPRNDADQGEQQWPRNPQLRVVGQFRDPRLTRGLEPAVIRSWELSSEQRCTC